MGRLRINIIALTILTITFFGKDVVAQKSTGFKSLSVEDFYVKMHNSANSLIVDVRLLPDYNEKRIPGALPASEPSRLKTLTDTLDKQIPLFVYCYDGDRSKTACKMLNRQLGFVNVYNLKKGFEQWELMEFPVDTGSIKKGP